MLRIALQRSVLAVMCLCLLIATHAAHAREAIAEVLGKTIYRDQLNGNDERLDPLIIQPLLDRFASDNKVTVSPAEIDEAASQMGASQWLPATASQEMKDQAKVESRKLLTEMVRSWKISSLLYKRYGGTVIFQQANPLEPVGAMRRFLEQQEANKAFTIHDPAARKRFYAYYTLNHPSVVPPDQVNYDKPWWRK